MALTFYSDVFCRPQTWCGKKKKDTHTPAAWPSCPCPGVWQRLWRCSAAPGGPRPTRLWPLRTRCRFARRRGSRRGRSPPCRSPKDELAGRMTDWTWAKVRAVKQSCVGQVAALVTAAAVSQRHEIPLNSICWRLAVQANHLYSL